MVSCTRGERNRCYVPCRLCPSAGDAERRPELCQREQTVPVSWCSLSPRTLPLSPEEPPTPHDLSVRGNSAESAVGPAGLAEGSVRRLQRERKGRDCVITLTRVRMACAIMNYQRGIKVVRRNENRQCWGSTGALRAAHYRL